MCGSKEFIMCGSSKELEDSVNKSYNSSRVNEIIDFLDEHGITYRTKACYYDTKGSYCRKCDSIRFSKKSNLKIDLPNGMNMLIETNAEEILKSCFARTCIYTIDNIEIKNSSRRWPNKKEFLNHILQVREFCADADNFKDSKLCIKHKSNDEQFPDLKSDKDWIDDTDYIYKRWAEYYQQIQSLKRENEQISNDQIHLRAELAKQALKLLLKISHTIRMYKYVNCYHDIIKQLNNTNNYVHIIQCMFEPGIDESITCFKNSLNEINKWLGNLLEKLLEKD